MKFLALLLSFLFIFNAVLTAQQAEQTEAYQYTIDLNKVQEDQLLVELIIPTSISDKDLTFQFPKIIPGTYEISDYGQFVSSLKAYDKKGREFKVERIDQNTWKIDGKKVYKITYLIQDSWDAEIREAVFEPGGTNIEALKNYVLSANGCFGFFENKEKLPYVVTYNRPSNFYATTSLKRIGGDFDSDIFKAQDYHELVDAPIMYCKPDTVNFKLGYGDIQISVYSPNGVVTAKDVAEKVRPMLEAQNQYLGNILPVDRYSFIIYLSPTGYQSGAIGALEHARSSLFCLVEEKPEKISKMIVDIASHEFFHMVTPLYIHSEEIHDFDFVNPKMSKHLWLYEGVIEYMAQHMQTKYGLVSDKDFLVSIRDKVRNSTRFKQGISLTEMSKNCLIEPYSKQYQNIYYKGAIVAMCLDLELLKLSKGKYDIQMLLRDLSGFYGQDAPFKDEELFQKIIEITGFKELQSFFDRYIDGTDIPAYNDFVKPFGLEYFEEAAVDEVSPLGGIENGVLKKDSLERFFISQYEKLDKFGKEGIGFKQDDVILKWDRKPFTLSTASAVLFSYMGVVKAGDDLSITVLRKNDAGEEEELELNLKVTTIPINKKHVFKFTENPTEEQLRMRNRWLTRQ
ncbi:MAG: Putative protease with the C-terminal PDZ domain [uncultured Aureispira sp.]|uniref:Protease with the C-terminal PDZ domain n=1 Tax=uncultured Aureispira sp. TaxID=1331704 RepID=A0A6S6SGV8_9BACT|nr:MAG: Putative protease with the C-terminal PDZ domain [uncultured Aureispira sp.]